MIQPVQPILPMPYRESGAHLKKQLDSQVIAHVKPVFKGHFPRYADSNIVYHNEPKLPEGVGEKLNFIA